MYKKKSRIFSALSSSFMDTMQSNYNHIAAVLLHLFTLSAHCYRTNFCKEAYLSPLCKVCPL